MIAQAKGLRSNQHEHHPEHLRQKLSKCPYQKLVLVVSKIVTTELKAMPDRGDVVSIIVTIGPFLRVRWYQLLYTLISYQGGEVLFLAVIATESMARSH